LSCGTGAAAQIEKIRRSLPQSSDWFDATRTPAISVPEGIRLCIIAWGRLARGITKRIMHLCTPPLNPPKGFDEFRLLGRGLLYLTDAV